MAAPGEGDLDARLAAVERRLAAVEDLADRAYEYATAANHLANVLDPRTLDHAAQLRLVVDTVEELRTFAADLERMAAAVWDETAVTRRLARIEDLLGADGADGGPAAADPAGAERT